MEMKSLRNAYGETLVELGKENKRIVVLESDLGKSTMSCLFQERYPDRYFEMGIAEQNMTSTAAGLSLTGKIPFVNSFAVFATGRAYDQIRQSIAIPELNVRICGASSGLSDFGDGATHQAVEDISIMRSIPNMTVLVPADAIEIKKMIKALVTFQGPAYVRISRSELPIVTNENDAFKIGKMSILRDGTDIAIFANGSMVSRALSAAIELEKIGVSVKVVNVSTIKPIDPDELVEIVRDCSGIVTAEEGTIIGGLGSAISECMAGRIEKPISYVGIKDKFGTSAHNHEQLLQKYGLTHLDIMKSVESILKIGISK